MDEFDVDPFRHRDGIGISEVVLTREFNAALTKEIMCLTSGKAVANPKKLKALLREYSKVSGAINKDSVSKLVKFMVNYGSKPLTLFQLQALKPLVRSAGMYSAVQYSEVLSDLNLIASEKEVLTPEEKSVCNSLMMKLYQSMRNFPLMYPTIVGELIKSGSIAKTEKGYFMTQFLNKFYLIMWRLFLNEVCFINLKKITFFGSARRLVGLNLENSLIEYLRQTGRTAAKSGNSAFVSELGCARLMLELKEEGAYHKVMEICKVFPESDDPPPYDAPMYDCTRLIFNVQIFIYLSLINPDGVDGLDRNFSSDSVLAAKFLTVWSEDIGMN
jgi:hypothetical protein